jgi:ParB-like chromosome segregation protein Spo0J
MKKELKNLEINKIIAYEKNNKIHKDNVQKIIQSIQANTYIAPIIVDENNVILAGHWRLQALQQLWEKQIEVLQIKWLSETQKKRYRLEDNKMSELSQRDIENIQLELDELGIPELTELFDLDQDIDFDNIKSNEDREISKKEKNVVCPNCEHSFIV